MSEGFDSVPGASPSGTLSQGLPLHLMDNLLEGCQVIDFDFRYLYVNRAAASQGRFQPDHLLGRTMMEAYPGIQDTGMFRVLDQCMRDRAPLRMENEFVFPDGTRDWFELRFEPVPEGVLILSIDISARRKAQEHSELRFRDLVSNLHDIVYSTDAAGLIQFISPSVERVFGFRPDEIIGRNFAEFMHPDDLPGLVASFQRALAGIVQPYEFRGIDKEGRIRHLHGTSRLRLEAGQPVGVDGVIMDFTELKQAQDDLRASSERWKNTFTAITDIICVLSPDHRFTEINRAGCASLGLPMDQIIGRHCYELVHACNSPIAGCPCVAAGQTLSPATSEYQQDGRIYELIAWPILGPGGQLDGFVHIIKDITERKNAEANLVRFGNRLELLARVLQELSQARTFEAVTTIVTRAGRSLVESDGLSFVMREGDSCHYVAEDAIEPLWKGRTFPVDSCISGWSMTNGQPVVIKDICEDDRIVQDLYEPTFIKSLAMIPIRSHEPIGVIGAYWANPYEATPDDVRILQALADSTAVAIENLRVIGELEDGRTTTRAIYDHLPGATFVWLRQDDVFMLVDINRAARNLAFGQMTDFLGKPPSNIEQFFPWIQQDLGNCFSSRGTVRREVEIRVPGQNEPIIMVLTYGFIPPDMVILLTEDVTDRRRTEEHLLLSQRLEAVGRLAGGVAHDFNNLLSVIISYAGFAMDELHESDPIRADVLEIRNAGQRAAALTRQLLAFSRKQVLQPEVLNLNGVISGIEKMLRRLLGEDIDITVSLAENLALVEADPGQIEQVVMNLAVNARDAMPTGGALTIETSNVLLDKAYADQHIAVKPGRFVLLSISDTGCGMDAETREHVFEPFFTTKEKGKGTGLGLAMVYGIVKQSGGSIWVYSEPGYGTTFKVYLPSRIGSESGFRVRPELPAMKGSETVLVVEDEEAVGKLTARILRKAGYRVILATSGGDAIMLFEKHGSAIDLLLSDVVMPQTSGRELAERLLQMNPRLKVLYMSGYTDSAIVHHGVLDAGTSFISKPFSTADLTTKVREVLDAPPGQVRPTGGHSD
jgi:PAS domain S-box-containing protein